MDEFHIIDPKLLVKSRKQLKNWTGGHIPAKINAFKCEKVP